MTRAIRNNAVMQIFDVDSFFLSLFSDLINFVFSFLLSIELRIHFDCISVRSDFWLQTHTHATYLSDRATLSVYEIPFPRWSCVVRNGNINLCSVKAAQWSGRFGFCSYRTNFDNYYKRLSWNGEILSHLICDGMCYSNLYYDSATIVWCKPTSNLIELSVERRQSIKSLELLQNSTHLTVVFIWIVWFQASKTYYRPFLLTKFCSLSMLTLEMKREKGLLLWMRRNWYSIINI